MQVVQGDAEHGDLSVNATGLVILQEKYDLRRKFAEISPNRADKWGISAFLIERRDLG